MLEPFPSLYYYGEMWTFIKNTIFYHVNETNLKDKVKTVLIPIISMWHITNIVMCECQRLGLCMYFIENVHSFTRNICVSFKIETVCYTYVLYSMFIHVETVSNVEIKETMPWWPSSHFTAKKSSTQKIIMMNF